jgi:hypothetical protein
MSLIRLLTTTRSLSDVKNEPSPYRMTEQGLLPKFGPRKAPSDDKETLGEGNGDRKDAGCSLKSESSRKPKWLANWWEKLFARKPRREKREPVQTEFSLDLVKVVRNDLSEAEAAERKSAKNKLKLDCPPKGRPGPEERVEEETVFGASRG